MWLQVCRNREILLFYFTIIIFLKEKGFDLMWELALEDEHIITTN
jgi:hypothetical protein